MANKLIVGEVLDVDSGGVGSPYPNYDEAYAVIVGDLTEDLDVEARYSDADEWYALVDILKAINDKVNDALE